MEIRNELYIGGQWVRPHGTDVIEVISPHSAKVVGRVPHGSRADMEAAVTAARSATAGDWGRTAPAERAAMIRRLAEELAKLGDDIEATVIAEIGAPIVDVRPTHVDYSGNLLEYYAALADGLQTAEYRSAAGTRSLVRRVPLGVVAAVVPWNAPLMAPLLKIAPALAAGCTVVLKPAPEAALTPFFIADAAEAAGLPAGVLNIVPAGRESGEHLVTHPDVDKVSFTGSTGAGKRIGTVCGELMRPVTLELGGKSAAIVLDDADLETTVRSLSTNIFTNSGQVCVADSRVLVPQHRYDEYLDAIAAMAAALPVGDPYDYTTRLGPLIAERQRDRVEGYIRIGKDEGATVVTGGGRPGHMRTGWYVQPTVFANVDQSMRIAREEIFGPVVAVMPYADEAEAIRIANDTEYGLAGSIWTNDLDRGIELSRHVEAGIVAINSFGARLCAPFGGVKSSGIGYELGPEGMYSYMRYNSVSLPDDNASPSPW
jgi:betaine-aldehyde dehydrogenase